jgi:hypothetical protein
LHSSTRGPSRFGSFRKDRSQIMPSTACRYPARARISNGYAALCAVGSRTHQAAGFAATVIIPNIFTTGAVPPGIPSPLAGCARDAPISGAGQSVFAALAGRAMKNGIGKRRISQRIRWQSFYIECTQRLHQITPLRFRDHVITNTKRVGLDRQRRI